MRKKIYLFSALLVLAFLVGTACPAMAIGDGYLLRRSVEDTCHSCHKTDSNSPSDPDSIKTHNSVNAGSAKWGGSWGVTGGKYGAIVCTTCHTSHNTSNIYLIRETIKTPDGSNFNWGGTNTVQVDFRRKSGTAGQTGTMGDDSVSHSPSSRICEVCHSQNSYHNSNRAGNADNSHYNGADCSGCHSHRKSFKKLQCVDCHDVPPTAGGQKHTTHFGTGTATYGSTTVQSTISAYGFNCGVCHNGAHSITNPANPHTVTVSFAGIATQNGATGAAYTPPLSDYQVDSPSGSDFTFNYSDGSCSNVYCHGNYPGSGKNASPTFLGTAPCGSCHDAANTDVPGSGSHSKHASSSNYNYPCSRCHNGITGGSGPAGYTIADKSRHVNGYVDWAFDSLASTSAAYSIASGTAAPSDGTTRAFGTCSNTYCHSNGTGGTLNAGDTRTVQDNISPLWGGSITCGSCHGDPTGRPNYSNGSLKKNSHGASTHASLSCDKCHYDTTRTGTTIYSTIKHINGAYDVVGTGTAPYTFTYAYNVNGGTCSSISCHGNLTTQWGNSLECLDCHSVTQGSRVAISSQFTGSSHHIQGVAVTSSLCYQCHWEATADGKVNSAYHRGALSSGAPVDLVIYSATGRPTNYSVGTTAVQYTSDGSRSQIIGINSHCLGCHNETQKNNNAKPFGDGKTPNNYAWDGYSIDVKYSSSTTTTWGKYPAGETGTATDGSYTTIINTGRNWAANQWQNFFVRMTSGNNYLYGYSGWYRISSNTSNTLTISGSFGYPVVIGNAYQIYRNTAPKNITKAYSAHGNAGANQEGWNTSTGVDGAISDFTGSVNVACFDCHNSHGSTVSGTKTSYGGGGILKDTTAGKGGYSMTYKPASGGSPDNNNAYAAGSGLCFDCHMNANQGTTPWGYGTFGATQAIMGYRDTAYFGPGTFGQQVRYPYKGLAGGHKGGHFGASRPLNGLNGVPDGNEALYPINGLCTPCHDPHGVSPSIANNQYAVPLLKGTWLTSPYKEDAAPAVNAPEMHVVPGSDYPTGWSDPYLIDQNTFGSDIRTAVTGIGQTDTQFAGLCLRCHQKNQLTDGSPGGSWKSVDRIHESVKGWGNNVKHNYSCSKCHVPHNSNLPRLMATNCLNQRHKGRMGYNLSPVTSGGTEQCYLGLDPGTGYDGCGSGGGKMPGGYVTGWPVDYSVTCHENRTGSDTDQSWNAVTQWTNDTPTITSGPSAGSFTAAGSNVKATVTWGTDSPSTSYVDYGLTSSYGSTTGSSTLVQTHSVLLQNLTNHSTYHYKVRSAGGLGSETSSGDNTFYISVSPTVPSIIAEPDAVCSSSCAVTLQWNTATDPDGGTIQYYVEVSTDSSFATVNYNSGWISGTSWLTPALSTSTSWNWRVKARDAAHTEAVSAWSSADRFYISVNGSPPPPTLLWPPNGFSGQVGYPYPMYPLQWNASAGATEYYCEWWGGQSGNSGWTTDTSFNPNDLPDNNDYYWHVKARNASGESDWSETWTWYDYWAGSCPFVYVWDGEKYQYVTDLQGAPIGYSASSYLARFVPYYRPIYVVLNGLKPDAQGTYSIKLRETLPEISYFDEAKLLAVEYPEGYELVSSTAEMTYRFNYANPFKLYTIKDPRPPLSALDKQGNDVLASALETDGDLLPHEISALDYYTFDFGLLDPANAKLVIDGWSVFGSAYASTLEKVQPFIEVVDGNGQWVKVKSFGEPAGDMKRMAIDLSGLFLSDDYRVRLNTGRDSGMAWRIDRVMIDDSPPVALTINEISADYADLHHRGRASFEQSSFTNRITAQDDVLPDNTAAYGYGKFTKYGDVKTLLASTDDIYAIMRHGDEISLTFSASSTPVPEGMNRMFVLKGDVYYKVFRVEKNVEPLPFHDMSIYPYDSAAEHYPDDAEHNQYLIDYNTRTYP